MVEDPLHELLSSPLKPTVGRRLRQDGDTSGPTRAPSNGPWLLGSLIVGAAIVFLGYRLAAEDTTVPTTTAPTTTTTLSVVDGSPVFPEGFTPVDTYLAMRVVRVLIRDDATFVTMSSVYADTIDTETSIGFPGGRWDLVLTDGRRITSTFEGSDPLSRGYVSVRFEVTDIAPDDIVSVALTGFAESQTNMLETTAEGVIIPEDDSEVVIVPVTTRFELDAGVALVIDEFVLSTTGGRLQWSLDGSDQDAVAAMFPSVRLNTGGELDQFASTRIDPGEFRYFIENFGLGTSPRTRTGLAYFDPLQGEAFAAGVPTTTSLDLEVSWVVFSPTDVTLPISTAAFAVAGP